MSEFEPSDWKLTRIPKLSQLDSLQRCLICKDFLKAPVITSCNHTFCSQCIRQHLMIVSQCPLCKAEQFESNLKRVILLEEIVLCFQALRDDLISLLQEEESSTNDQQDNMKTIKNQQVHLDVIEIPDHSEGLDSNSTLAQGTILDAGYVHCPVCGEVMKEEHVQGSHLDYCLNGKPDPKLMLKTHSVKRKTNDVVLFFQGRKRQKNAANNVDHANFYFNKGDQHHHNTKRIPKVDFSSLSTAKVKEKLMALKLSTLGSRTELEWRYNHYYLLNQSNLDSNHPLTEMELRQKLKQTEISHLMTPLTSASNTIYGDSLSRKSLADKDFPIKAWLDIYKDEFKQLVKQARKSRKKQALTKNMKSPDHATRASTNDIASSRSATNPLTNEENKNVHLGDQASHREKDPADDFDFSTSALFAPQ
ncbi:DNA repair protein rad18 [Metschnikowia bicuspidata var. bicuspidata NRRL YB-4993]|uniref:Postreplication repair E3 ubiquitin-protein ligase RAD18 n=1 Tax=Metschnikowia bicuspidata var. bicuspidata NRRL YB-4993 TaxID=869754 RepID=A0A1A0HHM0_9ASCO|nr:DNA repair protein rad18 [Metschnikowia bicuspidata var. bicuspidata NRRL YB-4993]OBA23659.1 DNA repair protein rad18 [Metschnikowia bicuspidata var. bicuspidata NRRL YB-4993]